MRVLACLLLLLRGATSHLVLTAATYIGSATAGLVAVNVLQNGRLPPPSGAPPPPRLDTRADVLALRQKRDFVAAWHAGAAPAPSAVRGAQFEGGLVPLGVLAPASRFITNVLFGGVQRGGWLGKSFAADGASGFNRFALRRQRGRCDANDAAAATAACGFGAAVAASRLDGRPALVLDYWPKPSAVAADGAAVRVGDPVWGRALGMRDELREVAPGVLLGLGSMRATGGALNGAPFVLIDKRVAK